MWSSFHPVIVSCFSYIVARDLCSFVLWQPLRWPLLFSIMPILYSGWCPCPQRVELATIQNNGSCVGGGQLRFKSFRKQDIVQNIFHHLVNSPFHNLPEDEASQIANTCIKGGHPRFGCPRCSLSLICHALLHVNMLPCVYERLVAFGVRRVFSAPHAQRDRPPRVPGERSRRSSQTCPEWKCCRWAFPAQGQRAPRHDDLSLPSSFHKHAQHCR